MKEEHQKRGSSNNEDQHKDANHVTLQIDSIYQRLNIVKDPKNEANVWHCTNCGSLMEEYFCEKCQTSVFCEVYNGGQKGD